MPDTADATPRLRVLDREFDYADGAEDAVFATISAASDTSSGSDELAAHIVDWPTKYHFSKLRANIIRALQLGPQHRVLDVGAGTGAIARYAGEQGAQVVALEGSVSRARSCAERCRDLPNVETVSGSLAAFLDWDGAGTDADGGFDVVLCIGVLEYNAGPRGDANALEFLRALAARLRPGGSLVVAIENQLGLKYLLGYAEDHHDLPYLGIEGYPATTGARTFSRRRLAELLARAGLPEQRWMFPYPDYKHVRAVLDASVYERPDAVDFVDAIVRWPVSPDASTQLRMADDRRAHRELVAAGLGPDIANSFLVVASAAPAAAGAGTQPLVDPELVALHFTSERRACFMRQNAVSNGPDGELIVDDAPMFPAAAARGPIGVDGWLTQRPSERRAFVPGRTVEQAALAACADEHEVELTRVLHAWLDSIRATATPVTRDSLPLGPGFYDQYTSELVPPDQLDTNLANYVMCDATLVNIDTEFQAAGGADWRFVMFRSLWFFAQDLITRGARHPWSDGPTVDALAGRLCMLAGTAAPSLEELERWRRTEARLHEIVHATPVDQALAGLEHNGQLARSSEQLPSENPFTTIVAHMRLQEKELTRLHGIEAEVMRQREYTAHLERELADASARMAAKEVELVATSTRLAAADNQVDELTARWRAWERRDPLIRFGPRGKQWIKRLLGRP